MFYISANFNGISLTFDHTESKFNDHGDLGPCEYFSDMEDAEFALEKYAKSENPAAEIIQVELSPIYAPDKNGQNLQIGDIVIRHDILDHVVEVTAILETACGARIGCTHEIAGDSEDFIKVEIHPVSGFWASDEFLKQAQVAEILGVTTRTLEKWRPLSKGPEYIKVGKLVRYKRQDVMDYLNGGEK